MKKFFAAIVIGTIAFTATAAEPLLTAHRPEGAREGTFVVVLANPGNRELRNVKVSLDGVNVYKLLNDSCGELAPGALLPVYGRYNTPGKLEVTLIADGVREHYTVKLPEHAVNRQVERQWVAGMKQLYAELARNGLLTAEENLLLARNLNKEN